MLLDISWFCAPPQVSKASKYGLPVKTAAGEVLFQPSRKQQLIAAKVQVEGIQVEDTLQSEKAQKAAEKEAAAAEAAERRAAAAAERQAAAKAAAAAEVAAKKGEVRLLQICCSHCLGMQLSYRRHVRLRVLCQQKQCCYVKTEC